nr:TonB-dependent receptor [Sphingobium sp. OAS761]
MHANGSIPNAKTGSAHSGRSEPGRHEAGFKSDLLDNHLRFNLAAYVTQYSDLQVQQFAAGSGGARSIIANAGKVQLKGFEAELTAVPVQGLTLDGSVGFTDTHYKRFLFLDPTTDTLVDVADQARPVYTPRWTVHVGGEYLAELGDMAMRLRVDYSHRTQIYFNALDITAPFNEATKSPPDDNLKARLSPEGIHLGSGRLELGV